MCSQSIIILYVVLSAQILISILNPKYSLIVIVSTLVTFVTFIMCMRDLNAVVPENEVNEVNEANEVNEDVFVIQIDRSISEVTTVVPDVLI